MLCYVMLLCQLVFYFLWCENTHDDIQFFLGAMKYTAWHLVFYLYFFSMARVESNWCGRMESVCAD